MQADLWLHCMGALPSGREVTHLEGLPESEVGEEDVFLQRVPNVPLVPLADRFIIDGDASGVVWDPTHQGVQQGCLSCSYP